MGIEGPILNCGSCLGSVGGANCQGLANMSTKNTDRANRSIPTKPDLLLRRSFFQGMASCRGIGSSEKRLGVADGMAFGLEPVPYGSGMANAPQQSAPDVAAAPLDGRPHRTVPGQATCDLWASHGWRYGARCR